MRRVFLPLAGPALAVLVLAGPTPAPPPLNTRILEGARMWLERGFRYDASYVTIPYPGGDVPPDRGACVDLIVRALRHGGIDLQQLIHEDRLAHPDHYRGSRNPDTNLDHRRAANHVAFFKRHALSLTTRTDAAHREDWLPGDLVYYGRSRAWHAGIVSDRTADSGMPYIIDSHQDADGVSERHLLDRWGPILGHFRVRAADLGRRGAR